MEIVVIYSFMCFRFNNHFISIFIHFICSDIVRALLQILSTGGFSTFKICHAFFLSLFPSHKFSCFALCHVISIYILFLLECRCKVDSYWYIECRHSLKKLCIMSFYLFFINYFSMFRIFLHSLSRVMTHSLYDCFQAHSSVMTTAW